MSQVVYNITVGIDAAAMSDEDIARSVQAGQTEAFGFLVDRYEKKLARYGRKFLARDEDIQDIIQDVFVSTYQNLRNFDADKRFSPWIYRIAHNAFVNKLRKNERDPLLVDFDTFVAHPIYEDTAVTEREQEQMKGLIDRCLSGLPAKYREVLVLHYFEELPYKDIADILQVPIGTVGIRLRRAKENLKKILESLPKQYDYRER